MDEFKLVAQISKRDDTRVDRVVKNRPISAFSHKGNDDENVKTKQLRRKTVFFAENSQSKLTKTELINNVDKLKKSGMFEFQENFLFNIKNNYLEVINMWTEGQILFDVSINNNFMTLLESNKLKNRLKLWARFFEKLSFWHTNNILHGNIKPTNLMIIEKHGLKKQEKYKSEFFSLDEEVPVVSLLDGAYNYLLESYDYQNIYLHSETIASFDNSRFFWQAPESIGIIEGAYTEVSDIFSMAAVMAWDLGLLFIDNVIDVANNSANRNNFFNSAYSKPFYGVFGDLYNLYKPLNNNEIEINQKLIKWQGKNIITETLKKVKILLLKCLDIQPHKRIKKAQEIAFELIILSKRIIDNKDHGTDKLQILEKSPNFNIIEFKQLVENNFNIDNDILDYILNENDKNSFFYIVNNKKTTAHELFHKLSAILILANHFFMYYRIQRNVKKFPFEALENFLSYILLEIERRNPQIIIELRSAFISINNTLELVIEVLPSAKVFFSKNTSSLNKVFDIPINAKHESLHNAIDQFFKLIFSVLRIDVFIIDDLHRADNSSLEVFLRFMKTSNISNSKWILSVRKYEFVEDNLHNLLNTIINNSKNKELIDNVDNQSSLIFKLTIMPPMQIRLLAILATIPIKLTIEIIEWICKNIIKEMPNILNKNVHYGKYSERIYTNEMIGSNEVDESLLKVTTELKELNIFDIYELCNSALRFIKSIGVLYEDKNLITGGIYSYVWSSEYVVASLVNILTCKDKKNINLIIVKYIEEKNKDNKSFNNLLKISNIYSEANLNFSAHATFSTLMRSSEKIYDIYSLKYITQKFQVFEQRLWHENINESDVLIPRIRERIGDLSVILGDYKLALKYYNSVYECSNDLKRKAVLKIKSYFPIINEERQVRNNKFIEIIKQAEQAKLFINYPFSGEQPIDVMSKKIIDKINILLNSLSSLDGDNLEIKSFSDLISVELSTEDKKNNKLPYSPLKKSIRENILSILYRRALGWIDNEVLLPEIIRGIYLAIERADGSSLLSLLFTYLVSGGRYIKRDLRLKILSQISDISSRIHDIYSSADMLLFKAWQAYFLDGNILECKKAIDNMKIINEDFPKTMRQFCAKINICLDFEMRALDYTEFSVDRNEFVLKKFDEYGLNKWYAGLCIYTNIHTQVTLDKQQDEFLISSILSEITDQILLYSYLTLEGSNYMAKKYILNEVKDKNIRDWFADNNQYFNYLPLTIEIISNNDNNINIKTSQLNKLKNTAHNFIKFYTKSDKFFIDNNKPNIKINTSYLNILKFEKLVNFDNEKLSIMAENTIQHGYLWLAYRICQKAGLNLEVLIKQIELEGKLPSFITTNSVDKVKDHSGEALALNYVLEFVYNLQKNILSSTILRNNELKFLATCIQKSIPEYEELLEETIARSLETSAKKILHTLENKQNDIVSSNILNVSQNKSTNSFNENINKYKRKVG